MAYEEIVETLKVPPQAGVEGFITALRTILKKPKVQGIHIDRSGTVEVHRLVREGDEDDPIALDLATLTPASVIRRVGEIIEVSNAPEDRAAKAIANAFRHMTFDHLFPIAFATGKNSTVWRWLLEDDIDFTNKKDELYGQPLYVDEQLPSFALFLCAGFRRESALVDTHKVYKILMPEYAEPQLESADANAAEPNVTEEGKSS